MQSLATKYRPQTFEECLSQRSIITILKNQLAKEQYTNCYGFCGPSGCGKTTIARIFGKITKTFFFIIKLLAAFRNMELLDVKYFSIFGHILLLHR